MAALDRSTAPAKGIGSSGVDGMCGADEVDDDDWLRVGRSFRGETDKKQHVGPESTALVLRVAKKTKKKDKRAKRSRRTGSSESSDDSDSYHRRSRKHRKKHKHHKKESSRHSYWHSDSDSDSSSYSDRSEERRRSKKRKHHRENRRATSVANELELLEEPPEGAIEVYEGRVENESEKLFEFDRAGDEDNAFYGSLYKHEQPLYRLATRRNLADGRWIHEKPMTSNTREQQQQQARKVANQFEDRYFGVEAKKTERRIGTKRLHMAYSQRRLDRQDRRHAPLEELTFIPLDAVIDGELEGLGHSGSSDDEQVERPTVFVWQTDQENIEAFIVASNKRLNERVSDHHDDEEAWLDLIAFQAQTLRLAGKQSRSSASSAQADPLVLEKQQAVLEKALEKNPSSRSLQRLRINLRWREQQMQSKSSGEDTSATIDLLEQVLEKDPTNEHLWARRVEVAKNMFSTFTMTKLRDLYARIVSVLSKQLALSAQGGLSKPSSSFIHVMSTSSLLGAPDPYDDDSVSDETRSLAASLLAFHRSLARAEVAAGYTERAVAHMQALLAFNESSAVKNAREGPQRVLEVFAAEWNAARPHVGEDSPPEDGLALPPRDTLDAFCAQVYRAEIDNVNAPDEIFEKAHERSLVSVFISESASEDDKSDETHDLEAGGQSNKMRGEWVYSNLHGTRIWVEAVEDESREYERILGTLRGTETFQDRLQTRERKLETKKEKRRALRDRLRDERMDYARVNGIQDSHLRWLEQERHAELTQWLPLRSSTSGHTELIELQPDRTILTDEIVPFIFRVPRVMQLQVVMNLLDVMGVHWVQDASYHNNQKKRSDGLVDDCFDGDLRLLIQPILHALDPSSSNSIALVNSQRVELLLQSIRQQVRVDSVAVADSKRVQFIRSVFKSALESSRAQDEQKLKAAWIEFEAEVVFAAASSGIDAFRALVQRLMESADGCPDTALLNVYATAELRLGNTSQAARICDKTLAVVVASLQSEATSSSTVSRGFHRLLFTRTQALLDDAHENSEWLALYVLVHAWHAGAIEPVDRFLKQRKRETPLKLKARLREVLDPLTSHAIENYRLELQIAIQQCQQQHSDSTLDCHVPYALHNLCLCLYAVRGLDAARQEFELFLRATTAPCHKRPSWMMYLTLLQRHQSLRRHPSLPPRDWRRVVAASVDAFPFDPVLLRLFVDAETSNTMSQTLRMYFDARRKEWERYADSPELVEWLFVVLCEFARAERSKGLNAEDIEPAKCCLVHSWGRQSRPAIERIRRVFEEMLMQRKTSSYAVGWRLYLRFEVAVGRVQAARKVFYRALASCPWSKALYLDGIRVLRPYLTESECNELLEFMSAKELHIRVEDD